MQRLAIISGLIAFGCLATPAQSADLDGPLVRERSEVIIERPAAPVVRERIIEHHYYEAAPEREYVPRAYAPGPYYYEPGPYAYAYSYADRPYWRGRAFADRPWRHRLRSWRH
jgi:hypothetical protein